MRAKTIVLAGLLAVVMASSLVLEAQSQDGTDNMPMDAPVASAPRVSRAPWAEVIPTRGPDVASGEGARAGFSGHIADFVEDQKQIWTSPARIRFSDAAWLLPLAGVSAGLFATDRQYSASLSHNPTTIRHYKTVSNLGIASLVGAGAGLYLFSYPAHNDHWRETGFLAGEAALNSLVTVEAFKYSLGRERPYQGNGNGGFFQHGTSFPSEHAAAAWSIAGVIAHEYPGTLPKLLAYGTASAVSYSRIHGRQHFPSDVLIGSALGYLAAQSVYSRRHDPEIGGGAWEPLREFVEGDRQHSPAYMGSPYVPLDSWIYPALERLVGLGYIKTAYLGIRPWTRMECSRMLEEASPRILDEGEYNGDGPRIYSELAKELSVETARLSGADNEGMRLDSVYARVGNISGTPLRDGYHFGQTIVNDYGRPYGEGVNSVGGVVAHAVAGPLSISIQGEYQHAPAVASEPLSVLQATANVDATLPLANGTGQIDRFRLVNGTIGLTLNNVQISFGQQNLWLGSTEAGPFLFSTNAEPVTMLRMDSVSPYEIPFVSRLLGPVRSQFFLGQLSGQRWVFSPVLFGPNLSSQPFLHGTKFSFHPTENLEIGIGFTAQFGGPGNPFTWGNFLRTFYSHKTATGPNPGKRLSEFDLNYRVPGLRNWLQIYVDSMVIDEYSPLLSTRPSINPGVYLPQIPKLHHMELRVEGVTTDLNIPLHFGPGAVYWDERYHSGYTNNGNLIGNWVGRRGRGEQGWLTYRFSPRSNLQVGYRHNNVDPGFLQGGNLRDLTLRADVMVTDQLGLSGFVQREKWHFPALAPAAQSNVTASVQLTFWPRRQSKQK